MHLRLVNRGVIVVTHPDGKRIAYPRAKDGVRQFFADWLWNAYPATPRDPDFADLRHSMEEESTRFVDWVLFERKAVVEIDPEILDENIERELRSGRDEDGVEWTESDERL